MGWCKKDVTPLLLHWSYFFLALTHQYACFVFNSKRISYYTHMLCMYDENSNLVLFYETFVMYSIGSIWLCSQPHQT